MEIDTGRLLTIVVTAFSFISAFAAVAATAIMLQVTKKFGSGILAAGFKNIASGVLFIALGIVIDAISSYLQLSSISNVFSTGIFLLKGASFVIGTYIVVIGSKKTADKLESLLK